MSSIRPQRWQIHPLDPQQAATLAAELSIHPLLAQVLINRRIHTPQQQAEFLDPESVELPDPLLDFPGLELAVDLLRHALHHQQPIAICGDYDADGMTSTAVLLRTLQTLNAQAHFQIPSRMTEGYGINRRMVEQLYGEGIRLLITVDNGIAALDPIAYAKQLGMAVIVTDHHDLPPELPPADVILNPKLIPATSPYRGMAGVGVAYVLGLSLADKEGIRLQLERPLLELLTLGTIADLAPLTGVNRRWVRQGLQLLPTSQIPGIRALLQVTGLSHHLAGLQPEAIGFGLGPRINAVGRLADPSIVIELLTTSDPERALELATECEQINQERQRLCQEIEQAAIAQIVETGLDPVARRVVVLVKEGWHHGVIGIVASRLVERYGAPVFIASQEGESIRGSVRGIPEFNVFEALEHCKDLFHKQGGHPAAGGFSMAAAQWPELEQRLGDYAATQLEADHIQPLIQIDGAATLSDLSLSLFEQMQQLQPCGMGNPDPVFCSTSVEVVRQERIGKDKSHLKIQIKQGSNRPLTALRWRWDSPDPLPQWVDIAYTIHAKSWQQEVSLELELKGIRPATTQETPAKVVPISRQRSKKVAAASEPAAEIGSMPAITRSDPNDLKVIYRPAPPIPYDLKWQEVDRLSALLPDLTGTLLIYGFRRPQVMSSPTLQIHTDRPQTGSVYDHLVLWSWPPSLTHLQWLLASTQPVGGCHQITIHAQVVPLFSSQTLRQQLKSYLADHSEVELLRLGQQWWVSPASLVAGLRGLGYACGEFPATGSVEEELQKLDHWFKSSWTAVSQLLNKA